MSSWPGILVAAALVWLAALLQQALAIRVAIFGCEPNFLLIVLGSVALLSQPFGGAWAGFFCGLVQGALAGANLAHYVISRCIAGFLTSMGGMLDIRLAPIVAGLLAAGTTIVAQVLLMFLAPPPRILAYLGLTLGMALYNGLLAIPLYALLRKWFKPKPA